MNYSDAVRIALETLRPKIEEQIAAKNALHQFYLDRWRGKDLSRNYRVERVWGVILGATVAR